MQMRKGPIVVMLLTAVLTYEGISRFMSESPTVAPAPQLQAGVAVLPTALATNQTNPAPYMTPAKMQVQPVSNPYSAPAMKKNGKHTHHAQNEIESSPLAAAVTAVGAIANGEDHSEMSITAPVTQIEVSQMRDVDLHMVPQVIVLPKMEEAQVAPPVFSNKNMKMLVKNESAR